MLKLTFTLAHDNSQPTFMLVVATPRIESPCSARKVPQAVYVSSVFSMRVLQASIPPTNRTPPTGRTNISMPLGAMKLVTSELTLFRVKTPSQVVTIPVTFVKTSKPLRLRA